MYNASFKFEKSALWDNPKQCYFIQKNYRMFRTFIFFIDLTNLDAVLGLPTLDAMNLKPVTIQKYYL
jgi:hypothetical protein